MSSKKGIGSLSVHLANSVEFSKHLESAEQRANPFANIIDTTRKSKLLYPDLLGENTICWRLIHSLTGASLNFLRALIYWPSRIRPTAIPQNLDLVIVSHITNIEQLNEKSDTYFGDLARFADDAGISTHTILINQCRVTAEDKKRFIREQATIIPAFLSPAQELINSFKLLMALSSLPSFNNNASARRFFSLARAAQLSARSLGDYRIGTTLSQTLNRAKPKVVVYTYEGHGWEKILSTSLHNGPAKSYLIGYQHAVLFPGDKSLHYDHGNGATPDHIFTTGEVTRDQLLKNVKFSNCGISKLGTIRSHSPKHLPTFQARGSCLIAPEGTIDEVLLMASITTLAAYKAPTRRFVLRLHPVMHKKRVIKMIRNSMNIPQNFFFSENTLEEDLLTSSWICYRGSSVAFQGILAGLRPIYLNSQNDAALNNAIPQNVLLSRIVNKPEELVAIIEQDCDQPELAQKEFPAALKFARDYFMPLNPELFLNHIKSILP